MKRAFLLLSALGLALLSISSAFSQGMMTEREIKDRFREADKFLKDQRYEEASLAFYDIVENGAALPGYQRISRVRLATALFEMKLQMVSFGYNSEILKAASSPDPQFLIALKNILKTAEIIGDETLIVAQLFGFPILRKNLFEGTPIKRSRTDPEILIPTRDPIDFLLPAPPKFTAANKERWTKLRGEISDALAYLLGRAYFLRGQAFSAAYLLRSVQPSAPNNYYAKSLYLLGTLNASRNLHPAAITYFRKATEIPAVKLPSNAEPIQKRQAEEIEQIREFSQYGIAQSYYAQGSVFRDQEDKDRQAKANQFYVESLKAYDAIKKNSGLYQGQVMFESAYAYFMMQQYHFALGKILGLQSPYYQLGFFPELQILQSLVFFENCKYNDTKDSITRFKAEYEPLEKQLRDLEGRAKSQNWAAEYYDYFVQQEQALKGNKTTDLRPAIVALFGQDKALRNYQNLMDKLSSELQTLRASSARWKESNLGKALQETAINTNGAMKRLAGTSILRVLRGTREDITRQLNQARIIELETLEKEKEELARYAQGGGIEQDEYRYTLVTEQSHIFWPYQGEYWRDEVGHYRQFIQGECKR